MAFKTMVPRTMRFTSSIWRAFRKVFPCLLFAGAIYLAFSGLAVDSFTLKTKQVRVVEKIVHSAKVEEDPNNLYTKGRYWKEIKPISHIDPSGFDKLVIFDSEDYFGSLNFLDNPPKGWSVFVINHKDDAQISTCKACVTFSKSSKAKSVLELTRRIAKEYSYAFPVAAYVPKVAAAMFAHKSNAPWVYVTDKWSHVPFDALTKIILNHPERGVVYNGPNSIFQPCSHFMDTFTWNGRGPLKDQNHYVIKAIPGPSLYQIVDNCQRDDLGSDWQSYMDYITPLPFVMRGTWAALDSQNTLIPRKSFWTLFAFMKFKSTEKYSSDHAILSLLVQRILWEINGIIGFVPRKSNSDQNSTSIKCPTCIAQKSMSASMEEVKQEIYNSFVNGTLTSGTLNVVEVLDVAVSSGLVNRMIGDGKKTSLENSIIFWIRLLKVFKLTPWYEVRTKLSKYSNAIYFTPAKSLHKADTKGNTLPPTPNLFREICQIKGKKYSGEIPKQHPELFDAIILVVSFNSPNYLYSINYLEFMFGRHFKHILYCGTGVEHFKNNYLTTFRENPVSFVDVDVSRGLHGHRCAVVATEMNYYNAKGYLYLSDDVILNTWNIYNQPFHLPWFQADIRIVNLNSVFTRGHDYGADWYPWNKPTGKPAIQESIRLLKSVKNDSNIGTRVNWFLRNLQQMSSGCDNCIAYMDADLYFIPSYMKADFQFFEPYFKDVFQELSIPTILSGITPQADLNIYRLRGSYLVGKFQRENYEKAWSNEEHFVHPVKLSYVENLELKAIDFYCRILRRIDEDLSS